MEEKIRYYQFDSINGKEGNVFKRTGALCSYLNEEGNWIEDRELFGKFTGGDADFVEISEEKAIMIMSKRKNNIYNSEKPNKIKIKLGTVIFIIVIISILFIGGLYYLYHDIDKKLKAKGLAIKTNEITTIENTVGEILKTIKDVVEEPIANDVVTGHNWQTSKDKSLLCLAQDGTFLWYRDSEDKTNNYYEGTYKVYCGLDAINYIANDLSEYGITKEEQLDIISRNEEYKINNYYCLVLNNKKCMMDGENTLSETKTTPYYGFYYESNKYLDFANMDTASYIVLNQVD